MFKNLIALKFSDHRNLRVFESNDYGFAKAETLVPMVYDEMADIAREYPIIFPRNDSGLPCALLGLEPGKNAYVAEDGRWLATYIPAHVRRYPFMFASTDSQADKDRFVVAFDADAEHFKNPNGHQVFTPDGRPTYHMENRFALLQQMQKVIARTIELVKALENAGLLVEQTVTIKRADQTNQITGFRVIDEKALNALADDIFLELRRSGALSLVYAHLLSWANMRQGPIAGKYPDLMSKAGGGDVPFLFEDDILDFTHFSGTFPSTTLKN